MTRVRVNVEHLRTDITKWIEAEAETEAETIANAIRTAVEAFDFDTAVRSICDAELEKFVRDAAGAYFRQILNSKDAHKVVRDAITHQLEGTN